MNPMFNFFYSQTREGVSFFCFPIFRFGQVDLLRGTVLLMNFSQFTYMDSTRIAPNIKDRMFLTSTRDCRPRYMTRIRFCTKVCNRFTIYFFTMSRRIRTRMANVSISMCLPSHLSSDFFRLLRFISRIFGGRTFRVYLFTRCVSKVDSFLFDSRCKGPFVTCIPISI